MDTVYLAICAMILMLFLVFGLINSIWSNDELPCDFEDSIDVKDQYEEGNVEIPENCSAMLNYTMQDGTRIERHSYRRGCPCCVKRCIRLFCPFGLYLSTSNKMQRKAMALKVLKLI